MSYGADFAHADPAGAPLDPTILIGADPVFWGALVLALAAALLAGWYLGARSNTGRPDAAQTIWHAIDHAAKAAMQSDDNALKGRAEALAGVIAARLGKTLALTGKLSKAVAALDNAIDGKGPVAEPHASGGHHDHPAGHDPHHDKEAHGSPARAPTAAAAAAASVTIIAVGPVAAHPPSAGDGHKHHKPEKRDLTQREQTDALRLAVAAFNEHWRRQHDRAAELRAAHAELSNPGPRRDAGARISGTRAH